MAARQERHCAVEVDRVAALDRIEDDAGNLLVVGEGLLELAPAFFAARLVARKNCFAERVLDAVEEDFDFVADLDVGGAAMTREFAERHAAFGLQTDVDDGNIFFDADDFAFNNDTFLQVVLGERLFEHRGEIFAARILRSGSSGFSHSFS